jgi:hypothetical protein
MSIPLMQACIAIPSVPREQEARKQAPDLLAAPLNHDNLQHRATRRYYEALSGPKSALTGHVVAVVSRDLAPRSLVGFAARRARMRRCRTARWERVQRKSKTQGAWDVFCGRE